MKIRVQSMIGAEPMMCRTNVEKRIAALGGKAVFGWQIESHAFIEARHNHCVWESPEGELVCVTPRFLDVLNDEVAIVEFQDLIEFERDDSARFDGKALPTRYLPLVQDGKLRKACEYMTISDHKLVAGDLVGCQHWTKRANDAIRKSRFPFEFMVPESLRMKDLVSQMYA